MTLYKTIATAPGEEVKHIPMTAEEEAAFISEQQAFTAAIASAEIQAQIDALEAMKIPADLDAQIAALKAQL